MMVPLSEISQPNGEDHAKRATNMWLMSTLAALLIGSAPDPPDTGDIIESMKAQGFLAWCIASRDELCTHIGISVRGLPRTDLDEQVRDLQDRVRTRTGIAFVQVSIEPRSDTSPKPLKPIDYLCWLYRIGNFQIPWHLININDYDCYAAVLLGNMLGNQGETIKYGTRIMNPVDSIVSQYVRGERRLPEPFTPYLSPPWPMTLPPSHNQQLLSQQLEFLSQQLSASSPPAASNQLLHQLLGQLLSNPHLGPPQLPTSSQLISQQLQLLGSQPPASTSHQAPQPIPIRQQQPRTRSRWLGFIREAE
ncbi:hypothetical protein ACJZ2D_014353 [Fusarium nematophilum]